MLKANELRIGNIIKISGVVAQITSNDFMRYCRENHFENVEPVLLTEEILEKSNLLNGNKFSGNNFFSIRKSYGAEYFCLCFESEYTATDIQYVHELQNIYSSICGGEELGLFFN
jgi:hypothetical protein